jgi:putative redox protein
VLHLFTAQLPEIDARGEAIVSLGGRPFTIRRDFVDDLRRHDPAASIERLGKALLVLHSPVDALVGIDNARQIFEAARHPKSFVSLPGADHLLTHRADAEYAAAVLAAWASRYVGTAMPAEAPATLDAEVVVEETGRGRLQQLISAGPHRWLADEPVAAGGLGSGPNPYDLLLGALGACTSMTLRLFADRKGWNLAKIRVALNHRKVHAEDCADCETHTGQIDEITREIALEGELDADQRARLLEIAEKCPVHRTLHGEIKVRTSEGG